MITINLNNVPFSFNQIIDLARKMPRGQKKKLATLLQQEEDFTVPEEQKQIVRQRIRSAKTGNFLSWGQVTAMLLLMQIIILHPEISYLWHRVI